VQVPSFCTQHQGTQFEPVLVGKNVANRNALPLIIFEAYTLFTTLAIVSANLIA